MILDQLEQCMPALRGSIRSNSTGRTTRIDEVWRHWRLAHPEAGSLYWACRTWTMWMWQPVYISVLAVHHVKRLPNLETLEQEVHQGVCVAYSLIDHPSAPCEEAQMIAKAGRQLHLLYNTELKALLSETQLPAKLAQHLLVDTLLSALTYVPGITRQQLSELAPVWLDACDLSCPRAPILEQDSLRFRRFSCCQHFRRGDGDFCDDCPKRA